MENCAKRNDRSKEKKEKEKVAKELLLLLLIENGERRTRPREAGYEAALRPRDVDLENSRIRQRPISTSAALALKQEQEAEKGNETAHSCLKEVVFLEWVEDIGHVGRLFGRLRTRDRMGGYEKGRKSPRSLQEEKIQDPVL